MSDTSLRIDDFLDAEISTKSDALAKLDRAATIGIATFVILTTVVVSLVFFIL